MKSHDIHIELTVRTNDQVATAEVVATVWEILPKMIRVTQDEVWEVETELVKEKVSHHG